MLRTIKRRILRILLAFTIFTVAVVSTAIATNAYAYSINSAPTGTATGPLTNQNFNFDNAWNELTAPFQNFMNNLKSVSPQDIPNFNPSNLPQPLSSNWGNLAGIGLALLSRIFGILKDLVNWLISLIK